VNQTSDQASLNLSPLRRLADAIREQYPNAARIHVALGDPAAGIEITEVCDATGVRLDQDEVDDWAHVGTELDDAVRQDGIRLAGCARNWQCTHVLNLPPVKPTALESWRGTMERVLDDDQDEIGVWIYDVTSAEQGHNPIAAGVVHLAAGTAPDTAAAILREAFAQITGDASVGVTVVSRDDDGGTDWSGRGVAEPE
jgi:hypothetical protein